MDGIVIVDKPEGWTSHDVVNKLRRLSKLKKVGHLGTLDPMATGVLPVVVGRATRLSQFYVKSDKAYEGVIRFGYSTNTYDREGSPTSVAVEPEITEAGVKEWMAPFGGTISQTPPPVSAKKVGGVPAYRLARNKVEVELAPVDVTIHAFELLRMEGADIYVRVECSSGTYLRAIAHEMGKISGYGAHLRALRRTRAGSFDLSKARTIAELEQLAAEERLAEAVIPSATLLPEFPAEEVDMPTAGQIRQGRDFRVSPFRAPTGARYVKAVTSNGELVAIGEARLPNVYHPILVL